MNKELKEILKTAALDTLADRAGITPEKIQEAQQALYAHVEGINQVKPTELPGLTDKAPIPVALDENSDKRICEQKSSSESLISFKDFGVVP